MRKCHALQRYWHAGLLPVPSRPTPPPVILALHDVHLLEPSSPISNLFWCPAFVLIRISKLLGSQSLSVA